MSQDKEAKDFRTIEDAMHRAGDAAGKVAAVLENPEHTEADLAVALVQFMATAFEMQEATQQGGAELG